VIELFARWLLERAHIAALRIHAAHHVLDGAILPGCVHRLEHNEYGMRIAGPKQFLRLGQFQPIALQKIRSPLPELVAGQFLEYVPACPAWVVA
jgi:hypothetical protein